MEKRKLNKRAKVKTAVKRNRQNNINLSKSQWKILHDISEVLVYEFYEDDPEEYAWVKPLSEHIKRKTLTAKDIDNLIPVLDDYVETDGREGYYQSAAMYEKLRDKLLGIKKQIR